MIRLKKTHTHKTYRNRQTDEMTNTRTNIRRRFRVRIILCWPFIFVDRADTDRTRECCTQNMYMLSLYTVQVVKFAELNYERKMGADTF